jgi:alkylated DNA repair dioxygenase AlkB
MPAESDQLALFAGPSGEAATGLPAGWEYRTDFISVDEETALLAAIAALPLEEARHRGYVARRRVAHFGTDYDFGASRLLPAPPLPEAFRPLRGRIAAWIGEPPEALGSVLIAEYRPGVPLGWHRDVPDFETVVGVSLGGIARMRFRRYPPVKPKKADVLSLELAPRSAYLLRADARWGWQHSIAPTPGPRWSITFRTRVAAGQRPTRRNANG